MEVVRYLSYRYWWSSLLTLSADQSYWLMEAFASGGKFEILNASLNHHPCVEPWRSHYLLPHLPNCIRDFPSMARSSFFTISPSNFNFNKVHTPTTLLNTRTNLIERVIVGPNGCILLPRIDKLTTLSHCQWTSLHQSASVTKAMRYLRPSASFFFLSKTLSQTAARHVSYVGLWLKSITVPWQGARLHWLTMYPLRDKIKIIDHSWSKKNNSMNCDSCASEHNFVWYHEKYSHRWTL